MIRSLVIPCALLFLFCLATPSLKAEDSGVEETPTPAQSEEAAKEATTIAETPTPAVPARDRLGFGLRLDTSFSAGGAFQQGFMIPSMRLTAFGEISSTMSYRLSLGQTREFSSVQLPQILPVEAYMNVMLSGDSAPPGGQGLTWRLGMFTPTFNPWWSPDLADIDLPDYMNAHRAVLLSRDLGTELAYEVSPQGIKFGVGAFNGNGILSLNSNNSKAFTVFARNVFPLDTDGTALTLGAGGYGLFQSTLGSINYKSDWLADLYLVLNISPPQFSLMIDAFDGVFEDSINRFPPYGGTFTATVGMTPWARLFLRWEIIANNPTTSTGLTQRDLQVGPILFLDDAVKVFAYYQYTDFGDGTHENAFNVRLRLVI